MDELRSDSVCRIHVLGHCSSFFDRFANQESDSLADVLGDRFVKDELDKAIRNLRDTLEFSSRIQSKMPLSVLEQIEKIMPA
jgi:hypothetical protein